MITMDKTNLRTEVIDLGDRTVTLQVPDAPEDVLAASAQLAECPETDPYWSVLWPAAVGTSKAVLRQDWKSTGLSPRTVLEVGCGVGLVGVSALLAGLTVTFSDAVQDAVRLAVRNAADNGFPDAEGILLDWHNPINRKFDLLLASDVLYELENHKPLLTTMNQMTLVNGEVWIGDSGRYNAETFAQQAIADGWCVDVKDERGMRLKQFEPQRFQILKFRRHHFRQQVVLTHGYGQQDIPTEVSISQAGIPNATADTQESRWILQPTRRGRCDRGVFHARASKQGDSCRMEPQPKMPIFVCWI